VRSTSALALALLWTSSAPLAAAPASRVDFEDPRDAGRESGQSLLAEMEALQAAGRGLHPLDERELDRKLEAFAPRFKALSPKSVRLLAWYLGVRERPLKLRLYAAAFLGLIGDPGALPALRRCIEDSEEDPGLRSAALQAIGSLRIPDADRRPLLDRALSDPYPDPVVREALSQLRFTGTDEVTAVERLAKRGGPDPKSVAEGEAVSAAAALGASKSPKADAALFRLLRYFGRGSRVRGEILAALQRRHSSGGISRGVRVGPEDLRTLEDVLLREEGPPAVQTARLAGFLGDPAGTPMLERFVRNARDPGAVAEGAQALAAIGDARAKDALRKLAQGLLEDPRFQPEPGRGDPREHAARIEAALAAMEPVRASSAAAVSPVLSTAPLAAASGGVFTYEGWPGEGRPRPVWIGAEADLTLWAEPRPGSAVTARIPLPKGTALRFDASRVVTRSAGRGRVRSAMEVRWRDLGVLDTLPAERYAAGTSLTLPLETGKLFEILAYRAEGLCFLRLDGIVYEGGCPQNARERFEVLSEPQTTWWLHAEMPEGKGWFEAEQEGVEFQAREF